MGIAHIRALTLAGLLLVAPTLAAHEIGTTRVRIVFARDHTYTVELNAGRATLERKLRAPLQEALPRLVRATHLRFGTLEALPAATLRGGATATLVLSGEIPRGAEAFTWSFGLASSAYALSIEMPGQPARTEWIDGDTSSRSFPLDASLATPGRLELLRQYLVLGFTHIVPLGFDHILFVLGMLLLSMRLRDVLTQVTAFTVAHSITLGLTMYGIVSLSPRIVEPMIALSIVAVAIDNLLIQTLRPSRVAMVFAFGLLHGLGFAGVLRELGLPRSEFITGLLAFNAGVELGQLAVLAAAWLLVLHWTRSRSWFRARVLVPASLAIACTGVVWMVERATGG